MKRFVEGEDRLQGALLPHCLDDYVTENNPVRVIEAFINELDLATLGFDGVVPETTGRPAYRRLSLVRRDLPLPSEVIFVNDGSTDNTLALLRTQIKAADPTIGIVDLSRNFGKEIALTAGLDYARGDAVVVIDADLQHPPELIPKFIARWRREDADVVYGQRASRSGESPAKKVTSRMFYRVINKLSGRLIPVDASDFCILSRRAVDALAGVRERHRFMKGLFVWIGYRQVPMLYEPDPRFAGVSKWNYWKLWNSSIEELHIQH